MVPFLHSEKLSVQRVSFFLGHLPSSKIIHQVPVSIFIFYLDEDEALRERVLVHINPDAAGAPCCTHPCVQSWHRYPQTGARLSRCNRRFACCHCLPTPAYFTHQGFLRKSGKKLATYSPLGSERSQSLWKHFSRLVDHMIYFGTMNTAVFQGREWKESANVLIIAAVQKF